MSRDVYSNDHTISVIGDTQTLNVEDNINCDTLTADTITATTINGSFAAGSQTINGDLTVTGDLTIGGDLTVNDITADDITADSYLWDSSRYLYVPVPLSHIMTSLIDDTTDEQIISPGALVSASHGWFHLGLMKDISGITGWSGLWPITNPSADWKEVIAIGYNTWQIAFSIDPYMPLNGTFKRVEVTAENSAANGAMTITCTFDALPRVGSGDWNTLVNSAAATLTATDNTRQVVTCDFDTAFNMHTGDGLFYRLRINKNSGNGFIAIHGVTLVFETDDVQSCIRTRKTLISL